MLDPQGFARLSASGAILLRRICAGVKMPRFRADSNTARCAVWCGSIFALPGCGHGPEALAVVAAVLAPAWVLAAWRAAR